MIKKIVEKLMKPVNRWTYPIAARKSIDEWYRLKELEFTILMINTNPETAAELTSFIINRLDIK